METYTVIQKYFDSGKVDVRIAREGRPVGESIMEELATCDAWRDTFATRAEAKAFATEARSA